MNGKFTGMLFGVVLTLGFLSAIGLVMAHINEDDLENDYPEMMGHMDMSHRMMMHGMHYDEHDESDEWEHMKSCPMMKDFEGHEDMTIEDMDPDGDGLCDICGMQIEMCLNMHGSSNMMG